ncbi:MAG: segregation and condensation protein A [Candidatus Alectryocaccobium sp.]|jgi:segregation and condensation protein A|nr:segregation/condensation protein A [Lachnospiraceae bacterium]MDY6221425.1 segregation/condensation protein A [Candidatus Alectryocaccobium sp.]
MALSIKLTAFEGPLDLLLHLIDKNKIDIYDIPIAEITDQYLEYIKELNSEDMDLASEFMLMAATLLDIKSRMLLPKEDEEEIEEGDPREELVRRLMEYKTYKYMSQILREQMDNAGIAVAKDPTFPKCVEEYRPPVDLDELLEGVSIENLMSVFNDVVRRQQSKIDPIRSRFSRIEKEPVSVGEQMRKLELKAIKKRSMSFKEVLGENTDKVNIVVTFLAVLELMHYGKIKITQEELFSEITIESLEREDAVLDESIFGGYDTDSIKGEAAANEY